MRIAEDDRKTAAVIRDAAMELFAARGVAGVTVREIAAAAGVSPGLIMHHFGSKEGLRDAADQKAARFLEEMLTEMARLGKEGLGASLAALFADRLEDEQPLVDYIGRLLVDRGEAADALFERLFEATVAGMHALTGAGIVRPANDEEARAAFLLANDLAVVLLRHQIERVVGIDPLERTGVARWSAEVLDVYTNGIFQTRAPRLGSKTVRQPSGSHR
jgi:TetR/AcrR family transcriptional regulator, regulator of cefoperazone and chloramphenicol sensitivity